MKFNFLSVLMLCLLVMTSCQREDFGGDSGLIEEIQNAAKTEVNESELPTGIGSTLNADYSESFLETAFFAEGLGYELAVRRGEGTLIGELNYAYFDESGRELIARKGFGGKGKGKGKGKDRFKCFKFVFPITLTMPDGTEITGEDKQDLRSQVRDWYEANPDVEEKPSINFPIEIEYSSTDEETGEEVVEIQPIESQEELEAAFEACKEEHGGGPCGGGDCPPDEEGEASTTGSDDGEGGEVSTTGPS